MKILYGHPAYRGQLHALHVTQVASVMCAGTRTGDSFGVTYADSCSVDWSRNMLLHLAIKLTVAEKAAGKQKIPVFIEDGISCVDEVKLPLLARMLKHLGTMTQVIHVTAHPGFSSSADNNVPL